MFLIYAYIRVDENIWNQNIWWWINTLLQPLSTNKSIYSLKEKRIYCQVVVLGWINFTQMYLINWKHWTLILSAQYTNIHGQKQGYSCPSWDAATDKEVRGGFDVWPDNDRRLVFYYFTVIGLRSNCVLPMKETAFLLSTPLGSRWKSYSTESTTTVWPALFPPWK